MTHHHTPTEIVAAIAQATEQSEIAVHRFLAQRPADTVFLLAGHEAVKRYLPKLFSRDAARFMEGH